MGRNCVSCQCLVHCANAAPQTRQDKQRKTQGKPGDREGQRRGERRRGLLKGAAVKARAGAEGRNTNAETKEHASGRWNIQRPPVQPGTEGTARMRGDKDATGEPVEGEGASGDVPGYVPTPEDLRLREVYGDWVHQNPGTHLDGGISEDGRWQG